MIMIMVIAFGTPYNGDYNDFQVIDTMALYNGNGHIMAQICRCIMVMSNVMTIMN